MLRLLTDAGVRTPTCRPATLEELFLRRSLGSGGLLASLPAWT
ncbi:hypothetical protein [Nonomuraea fuscirosea]